MRVVVTGGTGFVGSHLVDLLLARGDHVVCLVRDVNKARRVFPNKCPDTVAGDLTSAAALEQACDAADVIYHLAALTSARNRHELFATNVAGTRLLTETAARAAPGLQRFVLVSSLAAAGPSRRGNPRRESEAASPISEYGESKLAAEEVVQRSGLPWTVLRPPGVYGPRDIAFLTVFRLAKRGIIPLSGGAEQELSLIYIDDLVRALATVTMSTQPGTQYFVTHPEIVTARQFAEMVHLAVREITSGARGRRLIFEVPRWVTRSALRITGAAAHVIGKRTLLSADKAKELLAESWTCSGEQFESDAAWQAQIAASDGTRSTARWYVEHGWL